MIGHTVERVRFEFDVATSNQAIALQERISQFRATELEPILDSCLSGLVPDDRFLRLGDLELGLGVMTGAQLETELKPRIEKALYEAVSSKFLDVAATGSRTREPGVAIEVEQLRQLEVFLERGAVSWSAGVRSLGLDKLLVSLIESIPDEVRRSLTGREHNAVLCKRLASQFSAATLRRLLPLVARHRVEVIVACLEGLQRIQEHKPFIVSEMPVFRSALWESILLYLLKRRRSSFDERDFFQATLRALCGRYGVRYADLIAALIARVEFVPLGFSVKSVLIRLLRASRALARTRYREPTLESGDGRLEPAVDEEGLESVGCDGVDVLVHFLQHGELPSRGRDFAGRPADQWLTSMLHDQPGDLVRKLKNIGDRADVVRRLVQSFTWDALSDLIRTLEPGYAGFVMTYLLAGERLAFDQPGVRVTHWCAALGWLLDPHGRRFETKGFVYEASYRSARRLNMSHAAYLQGLLESSQAAARTEERFAALQEVLSASLDEVRGGPADASIPEPSAEWPAVAVRSSVFDEAPDSSLSPQQLGDTMLLTRYFLQYGALPRAAALAGVDELLERVRQAIGAGAPALRTMFLSAARQPLLRARIARRFSPPLADAIVRLLIPGVAADVLHHKRELDERLAKAIGKRDQSAWSVFSMELLLSSVVHQAGQRFDITRFIKLVLQQAAREERLAYRRLLDRLRARTGDPADGAEVALSRVLARLTREAEADRPLEVRQPSTGDPGPTSGPPASEQGKRQFPIDEPCYVRNAGVVLLWPFLGRYFEMLGMLEGRRFRDIDAINRAVYLLQYLVDGDTGVAEFELLLNKLLCGLDPAAPVSNDFRITEKESQLSLELLHGVNQNWPPLRNTSTAGLRESFLQREGRLLRREDGWSLTVSAKSYDVLLDTLPWSVSTIRLSWMQQALHVAWR